MTNIRRQFNYFASSPCTSSVPTTVQREHDAHVQNSDINHQWLKTGKPHGECRQLGPMVVIQHSRCRCDRSQTRPGSSAPTIRSVTLPIGLGTRELPRRRCATVRSLQLFPLDGAGVYQSRINLMLSSLGPAAQYSASRKKEADMAKKTIESRDRELQKNIVEPAD